MAQTDGDIEKACDAEETTLLMANTDNSKLKNPKVWYLDSSCSNHMSGNKECFTELDK